jgi:hypothetical protein
LEKLRKERDDLIAKGKDISLIEQMIQKVEAAKERFQALGSSQQVPLAAQSVNRPSPEAPSPFYGARPFQQGEHVIWRWQKKVGVFNRHVVTDYYITNQRVLFVNHEQRAFNQAPIQLVEAFVISSHTERTGSGTRYSAGFGMSFGNWNGSSRTYGVVNFMAEGQLIASVYVPDPHGLVREVKAIKKTTKVVTPKSTVAGRSANSKIEMAVELEKLATLFKEGMLTQDEYNKAKEKLLH